MDTFRLTNFPFKISINEFILWLSSERILIYDVFISISTSLLLPLKSNRCRISSIVWLQAFWTSERLVEEVMSKEQLFEAIKFTKNSVFMKIL